MRTLRRSSPFDAFSDSVRAFVRRRAVELAGLGLVGVTAAMTAALATWTIDDPSLNNATAAQVRNLLGAPGAIAADLVMQILGLGAIALLVPPAVWGWR
ncbi:MAG TPA: DNA translocase FtsK 4TM domain-containing protein, partial [Beijerinckiaceae bacterium]|nr:DNA translocase FtsK 4TM domain-containing protein [Beijerinckiaceae bacterium]